MAILKHIKSRNANYSAAINYLLFEHDEKTGKKIVDASVSSTSFTTISAPDSFNAFADGVSAFISATFTTFFNSFNVNIWTAFLPFGYGQSMNKALKMSIPMSHELTRFFLNGSP